MVIQEFAELLFVTYNSAAFAFPDVLTTLFIFLTLPVTTAAAERSFSKWKLIKNYLRSQMSQGQSMVFFFYLVAYLSSYREKAINALYELA